MLYYCYRHYLCITTDFTADFTTLTTCSSAGKRSWSTLSQHTSAYVSIRQHTSSIRQHTRIREADLQQRREALVEQSTSAYVSIRQHTSAHVSTCQHMSAYVIRPAYVSIRQHMRDRASSLREFARVREACLQQRRETLVEHRVVFEQQRRRIPIGRHILERIVVAVDK